MLKEATGRQRDTGSCLRGELSAGARQSSSVTTDDPEMGQDVGKEVFWCVPSWLRHAGSLAEQSLISGADQQGQTTLAQAYHKHLR